ncbi:hypothetical protein [Zavarzinia sp.]|uniref:hypothetical protein n=1 Tax=Zavarzinia sp. TaxID=2027920 RepID=UPI00356A1A63
MAKPTEIDKLRRAFAKAQAESEKCADAVAALYAGGGHPTRARLTTANARWARAAEDRDRRREMLNAALAAAPDPKP